MDLENIITPFLLIDKQQLINNFQSIQNKLSSFPSLKFRPHIKTTKSIDIIKLQTSFDCYGYTVSTIKEAEELFLNGFNNILYAVTITPQKLKQVCELVKNGCNISIITDSVQMATIIRKYCENTNIHLNVLIEIDTDDHRAGVKPDSQLLLDIARELTISSNSNNDNNNNGNGISHLIGVMTHAGGSYECTTQEELILISEKERSGCVAAAERLRSNGYDCPIVSIGSTPTVLSSLNFDGVTEVRAGVYAFHDLVMHHIGVCSLSDISLSVVTTVIGHQVEKNWIVIDAGWMGMSRDLGLVKSSKPYIYGYGKVIPFNIVSNLDENNDFEINHLHFISTNQEHGILHYNPPSIPSSSSSSSLLSSNNISIIDKFPVGTFLRILPNHACATAAQYSEYYVFERDNNSTSGFNITNKWSRFNGW